MRGSTVVLAVLALVPLTLGGAAPGTVPAAAYAPVPSPAVVGTGWRVDGDVLTWRSPDVIAVGDAPVEFWAGQRRLGVARRLDPYTFTLRRPGAGPPTGLSVRAGGRRLDAAPAVTRRSAPMGVLPPPGPANPVDPGIPGPYRTRSGEYTLPALRLPGYPAPVEMQALVTAPVGAPGARPLAVFLHGWYASCYGGPDSAANVWPCPTGSRPVPSYLGYRQAQELLASQGYLTVSISANGINGQRDADGDGGAQARSSLVCFGWHEKIRARLCDAVAVAASYGPSTRRLPMWG